MVQAIHHLQSLCHHFNHHGGRDILPKQHQAAIRTLHISFQQLIILTCTGYRVTFLQSCSLLRTVSGLGRHR